MKNDRLAIMLLACAAATAAASSAFAQGALPQCDSANYDRARGIFIVNNPAPDTVNQQCLLTVVSTQQAAASGAQYPAAPFLVEGYYSIEMSGGGGGGGGGASRDGGGGGGGAGAAPFQTIKLLSPGVYKLTLGKGGDGGKPGEYTQSGNPTSLSNFNTGEHVAGFEGADVWNQRSQAPGSGRGGAAPDGGSRGGSGGDSGPRSEEMAQSGGMSQTPGYAGVPGQAGGETGRSAQADAGGGGGAGVGSGGAGNSATGGAAERGDLGGGGGGGSGHLNAADSGARGGHGFIRLSMHEAIPQTNAPAPQVVAVAPAPAPARMLPQQINFSADAMFDFDKSALKPEGKAMLDDLARTLNGAKYDTIQATGQTDRIGGNDYNQKLSERRASAVKDYLVSRDIPVNSINAAGKGKTQPVTKAGDCPGATSAKVIACLAPDRRVDVEVTGSKELTVSSR